MKTVQLNVRYAGSKLNEGEFGGFENEEADYLLTTPFKRQDDKTKKIVTIMLGTLARNLRLTKPLGRDEMVRLLPMRALSFEDKEEGDCIVLIDAEAQVLIKAGMAEEMIPVRYRKPVQLDAHNAIQRGAVKHVPRSEAEKLAKEGIARPVG